MFSGPVFGALLSVRSLLVAIFILMLGSGFMAPLVALRLEGTTATIAIGLVATSYFAGLVVGALRAGAIVARVGHIRAFAVFVAVFSASALAYALYQQPLFWAGLRFVDGVAMAGVFVCLESWLNERAEPEIRGSILAAYMVALYSGQAFSQLLLGTEVLHEAAPFEVASILVTLAILPVCLTGSIAPQNEAPGAFSLRTLFAVSPLGAFGATTAGMIVGAFYGMAAIYARRIGLDLRGISGFIMVVILGGVVLQVPLGRLSDRYDRRRVIIFCFALLAAVGLLLTLVEQMQEMVPLFLLGAAFGGLSFAVYPLCVAHCNDRLHASARVVATGRLVLLYAIGSAFGPAGAALFMDGVGANGLFLFIALCAGVTVSFGLWRQVVRPPVPDAVQQDFQILPRTTPVASLLDPNTEELADDSTVEDMT